MTEFNWVPDQRNFLSKREVKRLINTAGKRAETAILRGGKVPVRDCFIVNLALSTGLRVMEMARLNCGDVFAGNGLLSLIVRKGKGGRKRIVRFNGSFGRHFTKYIRWKRMVGEPTGPEDPLLLSSNTRGHLTTRAIQKAFKRCAADAGIPESCSIHCLRHTYACHLYKASGWNLRLVQKQLGHARVATTEVYADVMRPDLQRALERLYR